MTSSWNNNKLIKDWIRPLQKSLTIETESKFINILGRNKYFNDYMHESLMLMSLIFRIYAGTFQDSNQNSL